MNEDRRRILQLVAEGKISVEDAAELLDVLNQETRRDPQAFASPEAPLPPQPAFPGSNANRARSLIIQVMEGSNSKVNLRIPLGLARAAGKFVPHRAQQHLAEFGIDLEGILSDLRGSEQGTILQVEDDNNRVLIAVE